MATILKPSFQLSSFQHWFPSNHQKAKILLQNKYNTQKALLAIDKVSRTSSPAVETSQQPFEHHFPIDDFDLFPDKVQSPIDDKLTIYLGGKYKLATSQGDQCLNWWRVSIFIAPIDLKV
jgi:hypothetical protein